MLGQRVSRRHLLRLSSLAGAGALVAACQPKVVTVEVEKIVRETIEVEKEVEKVVEKEVAKVVEKVVTPTLRPRAANETVSIRYGTFWPMFRLNYLSQAIDIFHQENPNIRCSVEMGGGVYRDKLATQFAAGTEPDTGISDTYTMQRHYDAGLVLDVMPEFEKLGIDVKEDYYILGHELRGDKLYGVPWATYGFGLLYNKTMFQQYGVPDPIEDLGGYWSFQQFESALRQIKKESGGKVFPLDVSITSLDYSLTEFFYGQCGRMYDFTNQRYTFSEPRTVEALEYLMSLYNDGLIIDSESRNATSLAGMLDTFSGQAVAIYKQTSASAGESAVRIADSFEWDAMHCPTVTGSPDEPMSYVSADANFVSSRTPYPDESCKLAIFLAQDEAQGIMAKSRVGHALKRADAMGYLDPPPAHMEYFMVGWRSGRFCPRLVHNNALEATKIPTREMEYVLQGKKTVKEACDTMDKEMNALVEYTVPFIPNSQWLIDFPDSVIGCKEK